MLTADLFVPRASTTGHKKDANVPHCVLRETLVTWTEFKGYVWIQLVTDTPLADVSRTEAISICHKNIGSFSISLAYTSQVKTCLEARVCFLVLPSCWRPDLFRLPRLCMWIHGRLNILWSLGASQDYAYHEHWAYTWVWIALNCGLIIAKLGQFTMM